MNLEKKRRRDELLEMLWHLSEAHELTLTVDIENWIASFARLEWTA